MVDNENKLKEILDVFHKEGILDNVILIGSWSLLFYKNIFENFNPLVRTTDIDFYIPNVKSIKSRKNLVSSLKEINYDVIHDTLTNKSTFISPDGFELEFLTKLNRDNLSCVKVGNSGIYAESLSYVEIYSDNYIEVEYNGIIVKVASPSSYLLQKLLINEDRKDKKEKDIESINHVLSYVNASKKYQTELACLYNSLPKKWKRRINEVIIKNNIDIKL